MCKEENVFSKRLRELREKLGLMQKDMAKKLNMPITTYNGYETGKRSPALDVVRQMADNLNVSIDYLTGRIDLEFQDKEEIILEEDQDIIEIVDKIKKMDKNTKDKAIKMLDIFLSEDEN